MDVAELDLPGVRLLHPRRFADGRGWFTELYSDRTLAARAGVDTAFVQDNLSRSVLPGTIRGLHFQAPPAAQAKLLTVLAGRVFDVVVDIRHGAPTFGRHIAVMLDAEDGAQLFVPAGFAHGFCTLAPDTLVHYKVSAHYAPAHDLGIRWDDPDLAIDWPVTPARAVLSPKDRALPRLRDLPPVFAAPAAARPAAQPIPEAAAP
jgi:dTDP-4-dehydrorhamnose 3,5-epimerase